MGLLPEHAEYLAAHAVDLELATGLGVRSVSSTDELPEQWRAGIGRHLPGIVFPWRGHDGRECVQLRPDTPPKRPDGEKIKYIFQTDSTSVLWAVRPKEGADQVLLVEGSKQCLVAARHAPEEFAVFGVAGCWGWSSNNIPIPDLEVVDGKDVVVIFDADAGTNPDVYNAGNRLGEALKMEGANKVSWVRLPAGKKTGLDDLLAGRAIDRRAPILERLILGAKPKIADTRPKAKSKKTIEASPDRPFVTVDSDRLHVINAITDALIQRWDGRELFNHGGVISRLVGGAMHPVDKGSFNDLIINAVSPVTETSSGEYLHCWPDVNTMLTVLGKAAKFTPLERITNVPFVRPDGTVCTQAGYDEPTKTLLAPPDDLGTVEVPEHPTSDEVRAARDLVLREWLVDMPFPDDASRANALALVLTPFIRGLVYLAPLAVVDGLQMGVGKNLFADCVSILLTGQPADPKLLNNEDDENRKMILSVFRAGQELFVFDEAHTLQGNALAKAVTAVTYSDRVLGVSNMAEFPNRITWMALGNNVQVRGDMTRRVYRIALRPICPNPQDRNSDSFKHPDLREWTSEHRPELITACLTLIRAWFAEGCPKAPSEIGFGSFERWQQMVGGILRVADVPGFLGNLSAWRSDSDSVSQWWIAHLVWLYEQFGELPFTCSEVRGHALADPSDYQAPQNLDEVSDKGYPKKLGEAYSRIAQRGFGVYWIEKAGTDRRHVTLWQVRRFEESGGPGPSGPSDEPRGPLLDLPTSTPDPLQGLPESSGMSGRSAVGDDDIPVSGVEVGSGVGPCKSHKGQLDVIQNDGTVVNEGLHVPTVPPVRATPAVTPGTDANAAPNGLQGPQGPGGAISEEFSESQGPKGLQGPDKASSAELQEFPELQGPQGLAGTVSTESDESMTGPQGPQGPDEAPPWLTDEKATAKVPEGAGSAGTSLPYALGKTSLLNDHDARTRVYRDRGETPSVSPCVPAKIENGPLVVDLETASADDLHRYGPGFVRLAGWTERGSGQVTLTTDHDALARRIENSSLVIGHNVLGFDLKAMARYHGVDLIKLASEGRVFDTMLAARQWDPPTAKEKGVDHERRYNLDALGTRLELGSKVHDLKALAKEFGGFDQIPVDDSRYREYLVGDVELSEKVYDVLATKIAEVGAGEYLAREHRVAAIAAQVSLNGFRVDPVLLAQRINEGEVRKRAALGRLHERYGVPLTDPKGKPYASPLASKAGKEALIAALAQHGVTSFWTTGKSGDIATSYEAMHHLALQHHHNRAVLEICKLVAAVVTVRTVYTTISDHLIGDRVHPDVVMKQSTGRWSLSKPGLTVMGKRGGRYHEREVFVADPGEVIVAFDLAQIDMRALAGLSGDQAYIDMLRTSDPHSEIARALFGDASKRDESKAIGHGWNYGRGVRAISDGNDLSPELVRQFDQSMRERFPRLVQWRDEVRAWAESGELLDNGFGRRMRPDPTRAHTQGPALMGQGCARDLMMEGLLRLPEEVLPMLRAQVHDEIVLSVPAADVRDVERTVIDALSFEWRGVPIFAQGGPSGLSWGEVYHKEAKAA